MSTAKIGGLVNCVVLWCFGFNALCVFSKVKAVYLLVTVSDSSSFCCGVPVQGRAFRWHAGHLRSCGVAFVRHFPLTSSHVAGQVITYST